MESYNNSIKNICSFYLLLYKLTLLFLCYNLKYLLASFLFNPLTTNLCNINIHDFYIPYTFNTTNALINPNELAINLLFKVCNCHRRQTNTSLVISFVKF